MGRRNHRKSQKIPIQPQYPLTHLMTFSFYFSHIFFRINNYTVLYQSRIRDTILKGISTLTSQSDEESKDQKHRLLERAVHDLLNPLGALMGYSELLQTDRKDMTTAESDEIVNLIHDTSKQILALLHDLRDFSAAESGKLKYHRNPCSLESLLEEHLRINQTLANKKNITLNINCEPVPDLSLDSLRIGQVIDNLLNNAIKFSPPDKRIFVQLNQSDKLARVSVRDEGPGITTEDLPLVFTPFQKLKAKPTGGEYSTRLGLATHKRHIENHQGSLWVESTPGKGAEFIFTLPIP